MSAISHKLPCALVVTVQGGGAVGAVKITLLSLGQKKTEG